MATLQGSKYCTNLKGETLQSLNFKKYVKKFSQEQSRLRQVKKKKRKNPEMQTFFSVLIVIWIIILLVFKCHDHFLFFPLFKMKKPQCLQRRLTICKVTTTAILADAQEPQE